MSDLRNLSTPELRNRVHAAIRANDRDMISALTAEIKNRLSAAGVDLPVGPRSPEKTASLMAQRDAILRG